MSLREEGKALSEEEQSGQRLGPAEYNHTCNGRPSISMATQLGYYYDSYIELNPGGQRELPKVNQEHSTQKPLAPASGMGSNSSPAEETGFAFCFLAFCFLGLPGLGTR